MIFSRYAYWLLSLALLGLLAGCAATRPINPPITQVDTSKGYRYLVRQPRGADQDGLVILAFSGGGTRAAAFSYGVLETLNRTEVIGRKGNKVRLIDQVDLITGVSGGSFTALAYGLYGDKLFDEYEKRFLKRNVQGELISRFLSPGNWGALWSANWGRSEMAAQLYDDILFNGATFADLDRGNGPLIVVTATDISTGARVAFAQSTFDVLCSDLDAVPLSRAAAASSAVPMALSPVTLNNYGGTCNYSLPPLFQVFTDPSTAPRPAARFLTHLNDLMSYNDGTKRPYVHLVDGGLADNLGMRGVLEALEELEALRLQGVKTPLDHVRRIVVFVVNSLSTPKTNWDESERPPNDLVILLKATGVPIDHFSGEAVELLKDTMARWNTYRKIRDSAAFNASKDPSLTEVTTVPDIDIYGIDVSFAALKDKTEREYLNNLPTSFVLPPEAVDRLRAAAHTIILDSPDFQRLLKDAGATIVNEPPAAAP
jgi:NTE family protein